MPSGKKMTFDETLALQLYHELKSDNQIAKAVGRSKSAIASWRMRRNLPSLQTIFRPKFDDSEFKSSNYRDVLNPTQANHMRQFLFQLFLAGKQVVKAGVKPNVGEFINVYAGRVRSEEEWKVERTWMAREKAKGAKEDEQRKKQSPEAERFVSNADGFQRRVQEIQEPKSSCR